MQLDFGVPVLRKNNVVVFDNKPFKLVTEKSLQKRSLIWVHTNSENWRAGKNSFGCNSDYMLDCLEFDIEEYLIMFSNSHKFWKKISELSFNFCSEKFVTVKKARYNKI